ncbi:MAG TPA: uroporphyrinogen decarboxylase [Planctomycetaceae bacterium]|nr:uroporphyrinogen decarboxylase [Planctomycetaceae bacterium]
MDNDISRQTITQELQNSRFLKACRREPVDTTPIWIMRQAGRYLPEYMQVRSRVSFKELCYRPELAAEVTVTARNRLGVDAAILFADLLPILEPMGLHLEYAQGEGPVLDNPLRSSADLERFRELERMDDLGFVFEAVRMIRRALPADIPLIGFAGAPFTLASYAIEGGGSRNYAHTKRWMFADPKGWGELMRRLSATLVRYLNAQIEAGCQAVQIFDSWAGCLSPEDYRDSVLPYTKQIIEGIHPGVPVINFLTGNPALLPLQRQAGGAVMGLDWRAGLKDAWATVGHDVGVQGNLDPITLLGGLDVIRQRARHVLDEAENRPGHIFNLGHGVTPEMNPDHVIALVDMVHEMGQR